MKCTSRVLLAISVCFFTISITHAEELALKKETFGKLVIELADQSGIEIVKSINIKGNDSITQDTVYYVLFGNTITVHAIINGKRVVCPSLKFIENEKGIIVASGDLFEVINSNNTLVVYTILSRGRSQSVKKHKIFQGNMEIQMTNIQNKGPIIRGIYNGAVYNGKYFHSGNEIVIGQRLDSRGANPIYLSFLNEELLPKIIYRQQ